MLLKLRSKSGVFVLSESPTELTPIVLGNKRSEISTQTEERLLKITSRPIHLHSKSISPAPFLKPLHQIRRSARQQSFSPIPQAAKRLSRSLTPLTTLRLRHIHNKQIIRAVGRMPLGVLAREMREVSKPVLRNISIRALLA
jgi:hypothetical protein